MAEITALILTLGLLWACWLVLGSDDDDGGGGLMQPVLVPVRVKPQRR